MLSKEVVFKMERDLKNKIIAITGGAEGIGFQITRYFLKSEGKFVVILDINEEKSTIAVEDLTKEFGPNKVAYIKCDVIKDLEETYQNIYNEYGIIDVLVNSAGLVDEDVVENCIDVNLTATIKWSLKFMELMRKDHKGNGGTIVNLASIFGYRISHLCPVYTATKFGVIGFTQSLGHKIRYDKKQVRVIAICPGFTRTKLVKPVEELAEFRDNFQWQSPEDVGEKVVEIFKIADSGTLWEIEGGLLREVK